MTDEYVRIPVHPETRDIVRVEKARRGVTYSELLEELIEDTG